ncbi:SOS response-associated peptidase [Heliorestis convoluta]|uniref:Abasic site processing protein n=1 Tax=Heliorestis convoluta TaxID=356322 RepID=A0A5Q2N1M2_9FIRM|nr:SOS response-associated peptidase [Heliorestis convoluta]
MGKEKIPYRFTLKDQRLFAFAGLWTIWSSNNIVIPSCTIVTTEPNDLVAKVHDRMPVILTPETCAPWLEGPWNLASILLQPLSEEKMAVQEVSTLVNSPRYDSPDIFNVQQGLWG